MGKLTSLRNLRLTSIAINLAAVAAFTVILVQRGEALPWAIVVASVGTVAAFLAPYLDGMLAKRRFNRQLRRGDMECWIRSKEPQEKARHGRWMLGLVSFRAPAMDFVPTGPTKRTQERLMTFLVSGKAEPSLWDPHPNDAHLLGPGVRSIQLDTTRGIIDFAGFPEAMERIERELALLGGVPANSGR